MDWKKWQKGKKERKKEWKKKQRVHEKIKWMNKMSDISPSQCYLLHLVQVSANILGNLPFVSWLVASRLSRVLDPEAMFLLNYWTSRDPVNAG